MIPQKWLAGISLYIIHHHHQVWSGFDAHLFKMLIMSDISDILSDQISLSFNMTLFVVATFLISKICHSIDMEHVAIIIYYWLGSTVDQVHRPKGTENEGSITRKL